jgi:AcrR family transcriptional regulator
MARPASRADVRTHILDTAFGLLAGHGVAWLTQTRVSKAAGVRQSHLTYYFPRRGDLLAGVAQHFMESISETWLARAKQGTLGAHQLPGVLTEALTDRRSIRAMLGLISAADEDPQIREALRGIVRLIRTRLAALFGMLSMPNDAESVALAHTFIVGAAVLHHARADESARREAEVAVRFIAALLPTLRSTAPAGRRPRVGSRRRSRDRSLKEVLA